MPETGPVHVPSTKRMARGSLNLDKTGPIIVLLATLLLGYGLRLHRLGDQNIWWDEGHAVWAARQHLRQVTDITARDVHPPLYLWMLHGWLGLVGDSELSVRYLSLIGGMFTIALTYVVARRLTGRRAALLATLLIATARFHIWWSQESRMYIWAAFFVLLSLHWFTRLRQDQGIAWFAFVLSSVAALYTLYLSVLVLILENLFVALTVWRKPRRRRFLFHWVLSQCGILILYMPWMYMVLSYSRTDVAKTSFPFSIVWQLYGTVLATGISTDLDQYTWLLVAFGLLVLAGIALFFFDRRQPQRYGFSSREVGLLLLLPLIIPPLVVYGMSIPRGFYYSPKPEARYLLLFAPSFYVLLAGTIAGFWQKGWRGRAVTVVGTLLVLGTVVSVLPGYYIDRYLRDDYQTAMATLAAYARPGDAVLVVSGDRYPIFLYHYNRRFPDGDGPPVHLMPRHSTRFAADNVQAELAPLSAQYERLWLASFERSLQDPDNTVEGWLDTQRTTVLDIRQGHNSMRLYARQDVQPTVDVSAVRPQHAFERPHVLGNGIVLTAGYDLPTAEFRSGDVVRPGIYASSGAADELVIEWVHSSGQMVERQVLSVPAVAQEAQAVRLMPAFTVYEYTPPGHYWIEIYAAQDSQNRIRLPAGQVTHTRRLSARKASVQQTATLGEGRIRFLGYTLRPSTAIHAGKTLTVDLSWQAQSPLHRDYTVFVHLLGPYNPASGGPLWAQDDGYPLGGGHPTSRWMPGQAVPDRHLIHVPENTPPGNYQIEIGLYDASTGDRLPVDQSDADRILLEDVKIVAP